MSVASAVYDSTCVVCDWVNNIVRRMWLRIQRSRQLAANHRIYEQMKLVDTDAGYHLANMNDKTNQHYEIELSKTKRITWAWDMKNDIDDESLSTNFTNKIKYLKKGVDKPLFLCHIISEVNN